MTIIILFKTKTIKIRLLVYKINKNKYKSYQLQENEMYIDKLFLIMQIMMTTPLLNLNWVNNII